MHAIVYTGTTFDTTLAVGFRRTNADLIKIDLINHLFTRRGERVMMPNYGTALQDLLFESLDDLLKTRVANEIQTVLDADPRIELLNMSVSADEQYNKLTVDILVRFIELDVIDNINLDLPLAG